MNLDGNIDIHNTGAKRRQTDMNTTCLWHYYLGHISKTTRRNSIVMGFGVILILNHLTLANFCLKGKMTKTPFTAHMEQVTNSLVIIHIVVYGPMSVVTHSGFFYIITFTCDLSRYEYIT
jgi:hypothetical protein